MECKVCKKRCLPMELNHEGMCFVCLEGVLAEQTEQITELRESNKKCGICSNDVLVNRRHVAKLQAENQQLKGLNRELLDNEKRLKIESQELYDSLQTEITRLKEAIERAAKEFDDIMNEPASYTRGVSLASAISTLLEAVQPQK